MSCVKLLGSAGVVRTAPELAAAVGIAGHDWSGRHVAWISRRSRKGFTRTTLGGGDLSWIWAGMGCFQAVKNFSKGAVLEHEKHKQKADKM